MSKTRRLAEQEPAAATSSKLYAEALIAAARNFSGRSAAPGAAWLYRNLRRHPDVFVPPIKERRRFAGLRSEQAHHADCRKRLNRGDFKRGDRGWSGVWKSASPDDDRLYLIF